MAVSFEHSLDLGVTEREVKTALDTVAEIGGLHTALLAFLGAAVGFFNGKNLDNFLVKQIYKK